MSTLYVDTLTEKTAGNGVQIPGHVVQVVTYNSPETSSSATSTASTSFVSTGYSVTITPTATSSKIILQANFNANDTTAANGLVFKFYRNGTALGSTNGQIWYNDNSTNFHGAQSLLHTDEPSTTSSTTYTLYYKSNGGSTVRIANDWQSVNIVAMEIAQ